MIKQKKCHAIYNLTSKKSFEAFIAINSTKQGQDKDCVAAYSARNTVEIKEKGEISEFRYVVSVILLKYVVHNGSIDEG